MYIHTCIHTYVCIYVYTYYIHIIIVLIIVIIPVPEDQIVIAQIVQGQTLIHTLAPIQLLQGDVCDRVCVSEKERESVCVCVCARARAPISIYLSVYLSIYQSPSVSLFRLCIHMQSGVRGSSKPKR
jgi:hypothetical protein